MTCEDYPCCGHTDGLGCDWVSPYEIVPCDACIQARAGYPYHNGLSGSCPTASAKAMAEAQNDVPEGAVCEGCEDEATHKWSKDTYVCVDCWYDGHREKDEYMRAMQEQYDDYWAR